jgi:hypothetical protein
VRTRGPSTAETLYLNFAPAARRTDGRSRSGGAGRLSIAPTRRGRTAFAGSLPTPPGHAMGSPTLRSGSARRRGRSDRLPRRPHAPSCPPDRPLPPLPGVNTGSPFPPDVVGHGVVSSRNDKCTSRARSRRPSPPNIDRCRCGAGLPPGVGRRATVGSVSVRAADGGDASPVSLSSDAYLSISLGLTLLQKVLKLVRGELQDGLDKLFGWHGYTLRVADYSELFPSPAERKTDEFNSFDSFVSGSANSEMSQSREAGHLSENFFRHI